MEAELSEAAEKAKRGDEGDDTGNGGEVRALEELGRREGAIQHQERARRLCADPHMRVDRACYLLRAFRRGGAHHVAWHGSRRAPPFPPPLAPPFAPPRPAAAAIAEVDYHTAMTATHHRAELAGLPAATGAGGE